MSIASLLRKTEHYDKDERYMATSDLCELLKRQSDTSAGNNSNNGRPGSGVPMDTSTERQVCTAVLRLLHDKSNDVQAIAVKTLGVLLTTVQQEQVTEIADSLLDQVLDASKTELRDVYAIGLRTLVKTIPSSMGNHVSERLVRRLLEGIRGGSTGPLDTNKQEIILASLEILTDLLGRFGATALSVTRQHEPILQMCLQQFGNTMGFQKWPSQRRLPQKRGKKLGECKVGKKRSTTLTFEQGVAPHGVCTEPEEER